MQEDISSSLQKNMCELLGDTEFNQEICITNRFRELNALFSDVHNGVSHINPVKKTQCYKSIHGIFRKHFPNIVTLKMHFLEEHVPKWIEMHGFGMALHGEQGGESIHREFNKLENTMSHVKNCSMSCKNI